MGRSELGRRQTIQNPAPQEAHVSEAPPIPWVTFSHRGGEGDFSFGWGCEAALAPETLPEPSSSRKTFGAGWGHFLLEIRAGQASLEAAFRATMDWSLALWS